MNKNQQIYSAPSMELNIISWGGVIAASWVGAEAGGIIVGAGDINDLGDM